MTKFLFNMKPIIHNSDIREIIKRAEKGKVNSGDLALLRLGQNCRETKVQGMIVNIIKSLKQELSFLWGFGSNDIIVAQRENAAATKFQRIKRAREGTQPKMPDLDIFLGDGKKTKTIFIEAKRIESPSGIEGKNKDHYQKQLQLHDRLRKMGYSVYLTNNPVFVNEVICKEIREFFE